ncbi:MAG: tol-pal system protein YbgF [Rubrivivax sp.]|nr:tol-pal system protein YbgF [Rubrivivax sp.]
MRRRGRRTAAPRSRTDDVSPARSAFCARPRGGTAARAVALALVAAAALPAQAQLFPDNEARKAIVDLRAKVDAAGARPRAALAAQAKATAPLAETVRTLQRSLVELNGEIEALRGEVARLRGTHEQLARDLADVQRRQADLGQSLDERLRRFEPQKVSVDGVEFMAEPAEKRAFDDAMGALRGGNFDAAATAFTAFAQAYPNSGYTPSARFWLGNALYGKKDYAGAIGVLREFVARSPAHPRAPEAMLAVANSQLEMKDSKAARATLTDLQKVYPKSEAAAAAKERLAALR